MTGVRPGDLIEDDFADETVKVRVKRVHIKPGWKIYEGVIEGGQYDGETVEVDDRDEDGLNPI
jgi:hypothetical protein